MQQAYAVILNNALNLFQKELSKSRYHELHLCQYLKVRLYVYMHEQNI